MFGRYLEGDSGQGEGLEVSLLPLQRTQHEAFLTGADVVVSVAVERPHTGREPRGKTRSGIKGLQTRNELNSGSKSSPTLAVTCVYAPSAEGEKSLPSYLYAPLSSVATVMSGAAAPLSLMEISTPCSSGDTLPARKRPARPTMSTRRPGHDSVAGRGETSTDALQLAGF